MKKSRAERGMRLLAVDFVAADIVAADIAAEMKLCFVISQLRVLHNHEAAESD